MPPNTTYSGWGGQLHSPVCKNLFKITGINHFSYVEMNEQGQFFWVGSNGDYLEKCINNQLVDNAPLSILKTYPKSGLYLIDVYQEEYKQHSLPVFELLNQFNYGHSFIGLWTNFVSKITRHKCDPLISQHGCFMIRR